MGSILTIVQQQIWSNKQNW